jgi:hypothetical protein
MRQRLAMFRDILDALKDMDADIHRSPNKFRFEGHTI